MANKAAEIASLPVVADAKDEHALKFYRKFGFAQLGKDPNRVFLPMGTIEQLVKTSYLASTERGEGAIRDVIEAAGRSNPD